MTAPERYKRKKLIFTWLSRNFGVKMSFFIIAQNLMGVFERYNINVDYLYDSKSHLSHIFSTYTHQAHSISYHLSPKHDFEQKFIVISTFRIFQSVPDVYKSCKNYLRQIFERKSEIFLNVLAPQRLRTPEASCSFSLPLQGGVSRNQIFMYDFVVMTMSMTT